MHFLQRSPNIIVTHKKRVSPRLVTRVRVMLQLSFIPALASWCHKYDRVS